jgi:predicted nucleotidyltransferase
VDPLTARIARRQDADRARADRVRSLVPTLAAALRARGATRVVLFGSLALPAEHATPHAGTDVDLAVGGLDERAAGDATFDRMELAGTKVDVVRLESASPRLLRAIERDGVEVWVDVAG